MDIVEQDDDYEKEIQFNPLGEGKVCITIYSVHADDNALKTKREQDWIVLSLDQIQDILRVIRSLCKE